MNKYFVEVKGHPPIEITKEEFIAAEQSHGFRSNYLGHPATGGFSGGPIVSYSARYIADAELDTSAPEPKADQPWERFFKVADRRPNGLGETVIAKLANGYKLPAGYDSEAHTWKCASWKDAHYNFGQVLDNVTEWRYQASK